MFGTLHRLAIYTWWFHSVIIRILLEVKLWKAYDKGQSQKFVVFGVIVEGYLYLREHTKY